MQSVWSLFPVFPKPEEDCLAKMLLDPKIFPAADRPSSEEGRRGRSRERDRGGSHRFDWLRAGACRKERGNDRASSADRFACEG